MHATAPNFTDHPLARPGGWPRDGFASAHVCAATLTAAAVYGVPPSTLDGLSRWLAACARDADDAVTARCDAYGLDAADLDATRDAAREALAGAVAAAGQIEGVAAVLADLARLDAASPDSLHWVAHTLERASIDGRAAMDRAARLLSSPVIGNA